MITIPKVSFAPENKVQNNVDYPKLTLDHQERALIVCIEPEPTVEFVHTLRAPQLDANGNVMKEEKKNNKGDDYEATVYEFIGQHRCFGDFNVVSDKGVDVDNCPTCRASKEEEGIQPPVPRYAMHVLRYSTQPGGWQLVQPFNAKLEAWVFSATRFNTIVDLAADAGGDLRKHDLRLGPCENKKFQKYDIHVVPKQAEWMSGASDDEISARKKFVKDTYANNQCPDLSDLIGRKIDKTKALEDIQKVIEKTQAAKASLGGKNSVPDVTAVRPSAPAVNLDDPWASSPSTPDESAASAPFENATAVSEPAAEDKRVNSSSLQSILDDL